MSLDPEDMTKLRIIAIAIWRQEVPSFDDLEWVIEKTYALDAEIDTNEQDTSDHEERADIAESKLEDALARIEELEAIEEVRQKVLRNVQAQAEFNPERLQFLRNSLAACLQSVDIALVDSPSQPKKGKRPRE